MQAKMRRHQRVQQMARGSGQQRTRNVWLPVFFALDGVARKYRRSKRQFPLLVEDTAKGIYEPITRFVSLLAVKLGKAAKPFSMACNCAG
jgi:hypothetical protein